MPDKLIRVYKPLNVNEIKSSLMIYGDLQGTCAGCQALDLKLDATQCPKCQNTFKYISFRNIKVHHKKLKSLLAQRPDLLIIDYEDYNKQLGELKAREFLK